MTEQPLPSTMRAAVFEGAGGPEVIEVRDVPVPVPAEGEVLVKVAAAGLNRADSAQRQGAYPPPPGASDIPGLEVSGTVVGVWAGGEESESAKSWPVGTEVCALLAGGGYAEYVAVPAGQLLPVPARTGLVNAAGLVEVAATVVSNLSLTVQVKSGDWVLVHGASGGIGTFAVQYLVSLGARVIVTGSSHEKLAWAAQLGAAHTINYREESFADRVLEITGGSGANVILDVVGAKYLADNVRALAIGGRLVIIGFVGGSKAELDIGQLLVKRAGVIATSLRSRPLVEKSEIITRVRRDAWPLVEAGTIEVPVDRTFDLSEARAAHEYFDSGQHRGKVLITIDQ